MNLAKIVVSNAMLVLIVKMTAGQMNAPNSRFLLDFTQTKIATTFWKHSTIEFPRIILQKRMFAQM